MHIRDIVIVFFIVGQLFSGQVALGAEADSLRTCPERFAWRKLAVPGVLIAGGSVGAASDWFQTRINEPLRDCAADLRGDNYLHFDDYIQYIPSAAYLGLGFAVTPKHGFAERSLAACTAWATTALLVLPVKHAVGELRPDGSARNSFPSGHTATAFVGAELVRLEYGGWWGDRHLLGECGVLAAAAGAPSVPPG